MLFATLHAPCSVLIDEQASAAMSHFLLCARALAAFDVKARSRVKE